MASVDERIVRMEFDNAAFEQKLATTLSSISQLEKALKFEGAEKGLNTVSDAASKFNMGNIGTTIEGVSGKFLALGTIGFTVLSNITTKAMQAGTQIVKSLSLDQVISGFKEYELNINSIQTILSNTYKDKTNLDDVTKALDELNTYADQTIYDFSQMTRNIGTFTAAGVKLQPAVAAIKGIANLAAMSGSTSDQASTAMYQLSQAMAAGELHAQDWISVVNAGMGGQMFQEALWQTAKALGTIKETDISDSFEHWKAAGNSFKDSLKGGWVTTDVLTTTLNSFSGSMTAADLVAKGFSKDQADIMINIGKMGIEAATKVRTFTQLVNTTKEAVGSGWSETFRIVIGDFNQATDLFSGVYSAIGAMVSKSSDARNSMLKGWADMGGRALGIEALRTAFQDLGEILAPIKQAFREVFPKTTMFDLMELTKSFELLVIKLRPSKDTVEDLHRIFKGFFSALQIGWEILKEGAKFFAGLFSSITGAGSGKFLDFMAKIGDFFTELNNKLVEGEGIKNFFKNLGEVAGIAVGFVKDLTTAIVGFFGGIGDTKAAEATTSIVDRLKQRFEELSNVLGGMFHIWEPLREGLSRVKDVLDEVFGAIKNWFVDLGNKLAAVMKPGDFDSVMDALNVVLLGGIVALLKKFLDKGLKIDLGSGLFAKISGTFDQLTKTLSAMQTSIKADALLKIAEAVGILTAAVLVLSLIDSDALTKALTAMAVGFGELMASFALLNKIDTGLKSATTFTIISAGMIAMSTAMLIFAAAVKVLSTMSWEDLSKGLLAVGALLGMVTLATETLSKQSVRLVAAGVALNEIAVSLTILAGAMKIFGTMSWEEIGKGLATVAGLLTVIVAAVNLMPTNMALTGPALVAVATSLVILGGAMKIFATLSWEQIGKGLVTIAGALAAIGVAMHLMPLNLPITATGLVFVGVSLIAIAKAMQMMGGMSWSEIGKGLATLASSLLLLAVATNTMTGTMGGAVAIGLAAGSLLILAKALQEFATISFDDLIHGLAGIAGVLAVLGAAAFILQNVVPAMLGLGAALVLIGGGFALFGVGVYMVVKGLEVLTKIGGAAIKMIPELIEAIAKGIPAFMKGVAEGFIEMAQTFADAAPVLIKSLVVILGHILEGLKELIPQALVVMAELIDGLIKYVGSDGGPKLIQAGIQLLLAFLNGIRQNIGEVVKIVAEIIKNFLDAFAKEIPGLTDSIVNFIIEVFKGVANGVGQIAGRILFDVGIAFITGLVEGLQDATSSGPMKWFKELPGKVLAWIGDATSWLLEKGKDIITGLLNGIIAIDKDVATWFSNLPGNIKNMIGDALSWLVDKGKDIFQGLWNGVKEIWENLKAWISNIPALIKANIPNPLTMLKDIGKNIIQGLWNGITELWDKMTGWISDAASHLPGPVKKLFGIGSPSTVFAEIGEFLIMGLQVGMENDQNLSKNMANVVSSVVDQLGAIDQINPTITPVLDLTEVKSGAQKISDYISTSPPMNLNLTYAQASSIASTPSSLIAPTTEDMTKVGSGVNFQQNIYAPEQLSTSDIYKQTRNQITMAKEALKIP
jgi:tape measure domain-containing protein